jgi:membrane protein required for colicin V production
MIDILFAVMMLIAIFKGYSKGLIVAVFSIIAFIVGLAAALKLSAVVATYLQKNIQVATKWLPFISFTLVFFVVVLLVNWGGKLIEKTFKMALLGWVNKIGGIVLYATLYSIIYSIFLFYTVKINLFSTATVHQSVVYPILQPLAPWVIDGFASVIPIFKNSFIQLEQFFEGISNKV